MVEEKEEKEKEKREQERCNQGLGQGGPVTRREEEVIPNHDSYEEREKKRKTGGKCLLERKMGAVYHSAGRGGGCWREGAGWRGRTTGRKGGRSVVMKGHLEEPRQQVSFITWLPQTSQAHRLVTPASHASLLTRFPFLLLFSLPFF